MSCPESIWLQTPELINLVALSLFLPELWVGLVGPVLVGLPLPIFLQAGDHHDHRYLAKQAGDQYVSSLPITVTGKTPWWSSPSQYPGDHYNRGMSLVDLGFPTNCQKTWRCPRGEPS